jgi:hypothetical protein
VRVEPAGVILLQWIISKSFFSCGNINSVSGFCGSRFCDTDPVGVKRSCSTQDSGVDSGSRGLDKSSPPVDSKLTERLMFMITFT